MMNRLSFEKVFYHLDQLHAYMTHGDCFPVHMIVGLTNRCNHSCIWCYGEDAIVSQYNDHDFAPIDRILSIIREAANVGLKAVTLVGTGEPTLHPQFSQFSRSVKEMGIDLGLFTNGSLLNEQKIKAIVDTHTFVRISCSAGNREEHNLIHHAGQSGNDFERILENVRFLLQKRAWRPFPTVGVQFIVSRINCQSLLSVSRLWKDIGVDYIAFKPVYRNPSLKQNETFAASPDQYSHLIDAAKQLEDERFTVYTKSEQFTTVMEKGATARKRKYKRCHGQAFTTFLDPDGKLYVCGNFHSREDFCIGNTFENDSFLKVWQGERRQRILRQIDVNNCPVGCRMDPFNNIVEDLQCPDLQCHPNFL